MNLTMLEYRKLLKKSAKTMSQFNRRLSLADILTLCDRQNPIRYRTLLNTIIRVLTNAS